MTAPAAAAGPPPAVAVRDLRFAYRRGPVVLDIPSLEIARGTTVFLHGPSGSGKTTLLGLVAGVLAPREGQVLVLGTDLGRLPASARDAFRAEHVGYVFQMFNLLPYLSVLENITLPCRLHRARRRRLGGADPDAEARALADRLGIGDLVARRVTELSVGQQQRVACARALLGRPELVIADEPTSALDADRRAQFLELLFGACAHAGATLLFVSHDRALEPLFDASLALPALNRAASAPAVA